MKLLRNPLMNSIFITAVSYVYCLLFTIPANHAEMTLTVKSTIKSSFWNYCTVFISNGYTKYIGNLFMILAIAIVLVCFLKRKNFDEYQMNGFVSGFIICKLITVFLIPLGLLVILSDRSYAIEVIYVVATIDWLSILIIDLVCVIKSSFRR